MRDLAIRSVAGLRASELQLCRTIVSAHSAIMRLPAISIFESWPIRNVTTPAIIGPAASTTRPSVTSPVASLIQPMAYGPTKPPRLPIELINARPPAAAEPVRKLVGRVQKIACSRLAAGDLGSAA